MPRVGARGWIPAALALAGCARQEAPPPVDRHLVVGYSVAGFSPAPGDTAWRTAATGSVRDEAAKRGVTLQLSDAQGDQDNQIQAVRTFVRQKVDAIVISPKTTEGWGAVLEEAKRAGIPVILTDQIVTVADSALYLTFLGSDLVEQGRRAAKCLAERVKGRAVIAELQGTPGSTATLDRKRGFEMALADYPGMRIVKSQSAELERARGKAMFQALLRAPDGRSITALFAHNDAMALGAIEAIEAAGKKPGADIVVVSVDGTHDAFEAMLGRKLACSVEHNPLLGPQLFDVIDRIAAGRPVPRRIATQEGVYTEADVTKEILATRRY